MTVPGPLPAMARVKSSWPVITETSSARGMRFLSSAWRASGPACSSPGPLTGIISRWSVGEAIAEPATHFKRSAWKRRIPKCDAIASVMSAEPVGIAIMPNSMPAA